MFFILQKLNSYYISYSYNIYKKKKALEIIDAAAASSVIIIDVFFLVISYNANNHSIAEETSLTIEKMFSNANHNMIDVLMMKFGYQVVQETRKLSKSLHIRFIPAYITVL
ncbi:hypothetical protein F2Q70_00027643 [Brassica cretica]|uniref:Uncharacterized protein n=1 Tax=Brassica cretica TaxID=69181 RepID=A0A8S9L715_BRACR|nr:hypothetical protein F2Q68_00027203 [Brassica cretica]KAF2601717.1 hypothetical protein F2Q70_00027643 [Brassica cretica]